MLLYSYTTSMDIRKEIVVIREILGLTQREFAQALHVAFGTVNRWESGERSRACQCWKSIQFCVSKGYIFQYAILAVVERRI